jgi:small-conductance mechanosensitive channel
MPQVLAEFKWDLAGYAVGAVLFVLTLIGGVIASVAYVVFSKYSTKVAAAKVEHDTLDGKVRNDWRELYDATKERLRTIVEENERLRERVSELVETNKQVVELNLILQSDNRLFREAFSKIKGRLQQANIAYDDIQFPR